MILQDYKIDGDSITITQFIEKATFIGRQVSNAGIPVIYNGVSDNLNSLEPSQDNNRNYYVNLT